MRISTHLVLASSREYLGLVRGASATEQSTLSSSIWVGTMSEFSRSASLRWLQKNILGGLFFSLFL